MWNRYNKFGNKQKTYNGTTYHSSLEADYAAHLDLLIKAKEIQSYEQQPKYKLSVDGVKIGHIIPDFLVIGKYGREEIHEVKSPSSQTPIWHWKWKHMQAQYPEYKYFVIQRGDF